MVGLKNEADAAVAELRELAFGKPGQIAPVKQDLPGIGRIQSADQVEQRAFAGAGSAAQRQQFAARHIQIHPAQDVERAFPQNVGFGECARREQEVIHSAAPPQV